MIRTVDFTPNSSEKYTESRVDSSFRFLEDIGPLFNNISKGGTALVENVSYLKPLSPAAKRLEEVMEFLVPVSQLAGLYLSVGDVAELGLKGKMGLDLSSTKEILTVAEKGVDLVAWITQIEKVGASLQVVSRISSVGLALALLSPIIDLSILLRQKGRSALSGLECYRTSYKIGLSLLAIYLFVSAVTISTYLSLFLGGVNFALSYL
jgi:hypothetical protein